jgi:acetyltransferase EpsM
LFCGCLLIALFQITFKEIAPLRKAMPTFDRKLLILGTGTFAEEIADLVSESLDSPIAGFVENLDPAKCDRTLNGLPIFWVDRLAELAATHQVICGLGTTHRKQFTDQATALGATFATAIHPTAHLSSRTDLAEGTIVGVGSIIASHSRLGRHVVVNRGVLIGHHTQIDDWVTISPGANIAGNCHIGTQTYVGMGAVILDHVTIGKQSVIGAGAVVTKAVPDRVMVVGVPARIVKENITGK